MATIPTSTASEIDDEEYLNIIYKRCNENEYTGVF